MKAFAKVTTVSEYLRADGLLFEFVFPEKNTSDEDLQKISARLYTLLLPYIVRDEKNMI